MKSTLIEVNGLLKPWAEQGHDETSYKRGSRRDAGQADRS